MLSVESAKEGTRMAKKFATEDIGLRNSPRKTLRTFRTCCFSSETLRAPLCSWSGSVAPARLAQAPIHKANVHRECKAKRQE